MDGPKPSPTTNPNKAKFLRFFQNIQTPMRLRFNIAHLAFKRGEYPTPIVSLCISL